MRSRDEQTQQKTLQEGWRQKVAVKPQKYAGALGIPTVLDRLIQQVLLQTLTPIFDPYFSPEKATAFGQENEHMTRFGERRNTSGKPIGLLWIWTWRNSSIGSTTTC